LNNILFLFIISIMQQLRDKILYECLDLHIYRYKLSCGNYGEKIKLMTELMEKYRETEEIDRENKKIVLCAFEYICKNCLISDDLDIKYLTNPFSDSTFNILKNIDLEKSWFILRFSEQRNIEYESILPNKDNHLDIIGNRKINISYFKPEIENWKTIYMDKHGEAMYSFINLPTKTKKIIFRIPFEQLDISPRFIEYMCINQEIETTITIDPLGEINNIENIINTYINKTKEKLTQKSFYNILENYIVEKKIVIFFLIHGCNIDAKAFFNAAKFQKEEVIEILYKKEFINSDIFSILCLNNNIKIDYLKKILENGYKLDLKNIKDLANRFYIFPTKYDVEFDDEFYWICAKNKLYEKYLDKNRLLAMFCKINNRLLKDDKKYLKKIIDNNISQQCMIDAYSKKNKKLLEYLLEKGGEKLHFVK
jgi:hypothetical protein